jgi:hypothetical protein
MPRKGIPAPAMAGQRKSHGAGFFHFGRDYQRQTRRGPQGVGRNQQRRPQGPQLRRQPPQGPRCQPGPQPPAISMTSDGCFNREGEAGTAPASAKDISATGQPAAMADAFKNMGESPRFGRIRCNYHLCCKQIKVRNPMRRRLAPQSWIDSLVLPSSPSCAPSTPISTFPRRLRRGRG